MKISAPIVLDLMSGNEADTAQLPIPSDRRLKNLVPFISKVLSYIIIPQFDISGITWLGASSIQLKLVYHLNKPFTLAVDFSTPGNTTFVPIIRYDVNNVPVRYKLWENIGELVYVPLYNGELIQPDFFIEIWNVNGHSELTNLLPIALNTSLFKKPNLTSPSSYLCNEFFSIGDNKSETIINALDNTMIFLGWNPSTQHWVFDLLGIGTLVNN